MSATIRHTQDKVVWRKGTRDLTTYALNEDGARYIIHCLGRQWLIMFLRFGRADKGHERVPWLEGRRTLALAKQSVEAHNQARCLAGPIGSRKPSLWAPHRSTASPTCTSGSFAAAGKKKSTPAT